MIKFQDYLRPKLRTLCIKAVPGEKGEIIQCSDYYVMLDGLSFLQHKYKKGCSQS